MAEPTLFLCWRESTSTLSDADLAGVGVLLSRIEGLTTALGYTPIGVDPSQPYAADGRGPALTLELRFSRAQSLEGAQTALADLVQPGALRNFGDAAPDAQAMYAHDFPTPDPVFQLAEGAKPCTFLVEYPGTTDHVAAWLAHYDSHHPTIMVRFPQIRAVATYHPAPELEITVPCRRAQSMQRNKVVFDSGEALVAALASPVLVEMRADSAAFAKVTQRPTHFANATHRLV